jgi:hypothetical protein
VRRSRPISTVLRLDGGVETGLGPVKGHPGIMFEHKPGRVETGLCPVKGHPGVMFEHKPGRVETGLCPVKGHPGIMFEHKPGRVETGLCPVKGHPGIMFEYKLARARLQGCDRVINPTIERPASSTVQPAHGATVEEIIPSQYWHQELIVHAFRGFTF